MRVPRGSFVTALVLGLVLALVGARYGYHRDELYFLEAGRHLSPGQLGQPDQPVLVPALAAAWHAVVGGNFWAFRLLPALAAALTTVVAALTCRELGGSRRQQVAASAATAVTSIVPATGHLFSTTTFDVLGTATTLWLLVRALGDGRLTSWLLVGLAAGVTAEVKLLVPAVLAACLVGLLVAGPRRPLLTPGPWLAALLAAVLAAPYLLWQASQGWPMREVAASITAGGSTSSTDRAGVVPLSFLMVGPLVSVVLVAGLVHLWRRPHLRWLTVAYAVFLAFVVVSGGKAYYPAGLFPAVLAAGAIPTLTWLDERHRTRAAAVLLAVGSVPTAFFSLPLAPPGSAVFDVAAAVNPDTAETVGWPEHVETVRQVVRTLPDGERARTVLLARNYGQAGAVGLARHESAADRELLPPAYSGHNAWALWGPPPPDATTAVVVGSWFGTVLAQTFRTCDEVDRLDSPHGVDNEEDGAPVLLCRGLVRPWTEAWPTLRRLG